MPRKRIVQNVKYELSYTYEKGMDLPRAERIDAFLISFDIHVFLIPKYKYAYDKLNNPSVAHFCDSRSTISSILIPSRLQRADI